jgi:hypothetical protein
VNRLKTAVRRLCPLVLVAFGAGAIAAHADNPPKAPRAPAPALALAAPASARPPVFTKLVAPCRPVRKRPATSATPPSQALLDAFAILRRERRPEDALTPQALRALETRGLKPVSADSARLLRSGPDDARAWVVPVPDVNAGFPFVCGPKDKPREGLAVVAVGGAPAGGGGALGDLVRGRAPASVDACAGTNHDMLGVSGIVPNGVAAVFLTAPDGTAVRADVKDNGYEFLVPATKTLGQRYVVWTGADGTPHVQPIVAFGHIPTTLCKRMATSAFSKAPRVTPVGGLGPCPPVALPVPAPAPHTKRPSPTRLLWAACPSAGVALLEPGVGRPLPLPIAPATPKKAPSRRHR